MQDPTKRFSDRVSDYVNYRPSYPDQIVPDLASFCHLTSHSVIADVGAGTGKLTELFINDNYSVTAIEPNREMREAAESLFSECEGFVSVPGSAEHTLLGDRTVDLIVAGQAFHWFDQVAAKTEFERILKPDGNIALIWNQRRVERPFQREYDSMLSEHCADYQLSNHRNVTTTDIELFCAPRKVHVHSYDYSQQFDMQSFLGRMTSSSYTPKSGTQAHRNLLVAANALFDRYAKNGVLAFEYETLVYLA